MSQNTQGGRMPVFGYVAIPAQGTIDALQTDLNSLSHCQVIRAENKEILVLVTDTPDEDAEKHLQAQLKKIDTLQSLSMTFGYNDEQQFEKKRGDHEI
jgi:nitrate reductase NapAB chaperone NapD